MKRSGLAIASFIFGFFWWVPFLGLIFGALGMALGAVAIYSIRKDPKQTGGFWFAVFGIILGFLGCVIWLALVAWGAMKLISFFHPAMPKMPFSWPTEPGFWTILGAIIGMVPILFLLALASGILGFAFWIWMLMDCALKEFEKPADKIAWLILIIFTNWIGATIYFFVCPTGRAGRKKLVK